MYERFDSQARQVGSRPALVDRLRDEIAAAVREAREHPGGRALDPDYAAANEVLRRLEASGLLSPDGGRADEGEVEAVAEAIRLAFHKSTNGWYELANIAIAALDAARGGRAVVLTEKDLLALDALMGDVRRRWGGNLIGHGEVPKAYRRLSPKLSPSQERP